MEFHPIANIFPLMQGKAFDELCEDIKANGLREAIWLYEGKIIDGRNRYRACEKVSLTPTYRTYEGGNPYGFVGSLNVHRRHLTVGMRALMVDRLATATRNYTAAAGAVTAEQAGAVVGVSRMQIEKAKKVRRSGDATLLEMAQDGTLTLQQASRLTCLPAERRSRVLRTVQSAAAGGESANREIENVLRSAGIAPVGNPTFIRDLDEMAVRILDFFTAPQIDILWDIIAKKQAEMIKARREKGLAQSGVPEG